MSRLRSVEPGARAEILRFLVIGATTVLIDFATYRALLAAGAEVSWSKALGFVAGTVFAYFGNRRFTFARATPQPGSVVRFAALYTATLALNVGTNRLVLASALAVVPKSLAVPIAFLSATTLSAVLNFVGMKFLIFRPAR